AHEHRRRIRDELIHLHWIHDAGAGCRGFDDPIELARQFADVALRTDRDAHVRIGILGKRNVEGRRDVLVNVADRYVTDLTNDVNGVARRPEYDRLANGISVRKIRRGERAVHNTDIWRLGDGVAGPEIAPARKRNLERREIPRA